MKPGEYTILLAEDTDDLRNQFVDLLSHNGFKVIPFVDGKALYNGAKKYSGDLSKMLIVSDTDMPFLSGDEACKILLESPEFQKVIMIGMSENTNNEVYWQGVGVLNSFIYKGNSITNPNSRKNISNLVISCLETILGNPSLYLLPNQSYRRKI